MATPGSWTEREVRAAVSAYFRILEAELAGTLVNKSDLYRDLSKQYTARSPKAFELKFQNISAILYEQRLPYCSGLKPRHNYQRLLKLVVLDRLDRMPIPSVEPHEILFSKLRELTKRGPFVVKRKGAGRFGLAIENALGIEQNSDKSADFMGIELKTKADRSLQTLFSRTPSRYVEDHDKKGFFERHSYLDSKRGRKALYTSFGCSPDTLGFRLRVVGLTIQVLRRDSVVLEYDAEAIEAALLSKHTQTAYLAISPRNEGGKELCVLTEIRYCKWPSIIRFLRLLSEGNIFLDLTMSQAENGSIKDHGFLWRSRSESLDTLYLHSQAVDI